MKLTVKEENELLELLKTRFNQHMERHPDVKWDAVEKKLRDYPDKLGALQQMEATGGEPDVVEFNSKSNEYHFYDCSPESPKGRRSACYDKEALEARKKFPPKHSAKEMAKNMGVEILTEEEYKKLQLVGNFDTKTSSWIQTPPSIRKLGGALFGDFRFNHVFIYHNGAESYYAARGFRSSLKV